jgi:putative endopeptidase
MNKRLVTIAIATVLLAACQPKEQASVKPDILVADRDTTANPADDFFAYANGGWLKRTEIPADEVNWGIGNMVQKELHEQLRHINEEAMNKHAASGADQQIGDFWYSAMDTVSIEKNGVEPLRHELNKIAAMTTPQDVMAQAAHMHTYGVGVFFDEGVQQDEKNSDVEAYYLSQGGIGLPERDYYFSPDAHASKVRAAYPGYIATLFRLMGADSAQAAGKATAIVGLETRLARASRPLQDLRDPYLNYNKVAVAELKTLSPGIEWAQTLQQIGVQHIDSVIVGQPDFYKALDSIITHTDMQILKDYMSYNLVRAFASHMSKPFADANFNFYSKLIRGAQEQHPRWRRALDAEERAIGEELGQLFVREYFPATAKKRYEDMVENMRAAYKNRIEQLNWMTDSTKQKAIHKLLVLKKKVGYPDKWKDFSALKIDRGPFVLNMMRANQWWNNHELSKLGKPVDRSEWDMTPQTYNAYYNQSNNEIVLPAAQMSVPGYKDSELDDALVYGYTAASTIGHEITHGFDDEGRKYDEHGNLSSWWSAQDTAQFEKRARVLVAQFNKMNPIDTYHVNGAASLGENLADLGGLLIGFDAFRQTDMYKKGEKMNGMTPAQRFFLGYALGWLLKQRPESLINQLKTDVHAPAQCRVNGPLPNVPAFYDAFAVKPGNKMYLPDSARVHLW